MTKEEYDEVKSQLIRATKYEKLSRIIKDLEENISKLQSLSVDGEGKDDVKFELKVSKGPEIKFNTLYSFSSLNFDSVDLAQLLGVETMVDKFKKDMTTYLTNLIAECKAKRDQI